MLLKGIRHLLYDQGFTIKGVQRILKDQGIRYVIGIGEGRVMEPIAQSPADQEGETATSASATPAMQLAGPPSESGKALDEADREKLADVLRELLDCKRILERARES